MEWNLWQLTLTLFFFLLNMRTFGLFYIDKKRSEKNKYRLSEKKLLLSAALMGGVGALLGSILFKHKTRKHLFRFTLPVFFLLTVLMYILLIFRA